MLGEVMLKQRKRELTTEWSTPGLGLRTDPVLALHRRLAAAY